MSELLKKKESMTITNRYSFPVTDEMKGILDELKSAENYDVNEMLREFARDIIKKAREASTQEQTA